MTRPDRHRRFLATRAFAQAALDVVAAHFGVPVEKIRGRRRFRAVSRTRSVAAYVIRHATPMSFPEIGMMLGGYDHSSMILACRRVEKALLIDAVLKWDLLQIARILAEQQQIRLSLPQEVKMLELEPVTGIEPAASSLPRTRSSS